MPRVTRSHTIRRHLVDGGLVDLRLTEQEEKAGPDGQDADGFSLRQQRDTGGTLVVVVGAYGPNWLRTLAELSGRLEQRHIKCTVIAEGPGVADHEVMVRWATSAELQARAVDQAARQAPLKAALRQGEAQQRAAEERQALEDAGQFGLF
ncbi:hypothetical protein C1J00_25755 [Streptomyces cahuitamycinicus]|uniref:Uncharacterized protein n=2 Tax=Streptomyces cahuitamycinicus TaxID=2070367 RepID=A0A2N8TK76_9ACTN|nr:hypothetical protein C1J00_25755 [Streptomyces cahuitamycinicus]